MIAFLSVMSEDPAAPSRACRRGLVCLASGRRAKESITGSDPAVLTGPAIQRQAKANAAPRGALLYPRRSREGFGGYSWV